MAITKLKGKTIQVEIWTDRYRIKGNVFLPLADQGAYRGRLSDMLNDPEKNFLPVTNVSLSLLTGNEDVWEGRFLAVNKTAITLVRAVKE